MSFLKELFNSIARTLGRIIAYVLIGFLIFFVFSKFTNAQETGRIFYNGVQQGNIFFFNNADDVAQWNNTNANTIRYDNNNLIMNTGTTYTFSSRFTIMLQDSIDTTTTIEVSPGYYRNGSLKTFSDTTCDVAINGKLIDVTANKKTTEHYITVTCPEISFSQNNNYIMIRFFINNTGQYYNIIEMSKSGTIYKDNTTLTESDKIIISQNQNAENIINNQNQNTEDIINNQNQNTQDIVDSITDGVNQTNDKLNEMLDTSVPSIDNIPNFNFNNGPISGLLTMPITWFNAFVNPGLCKPISLGELLGTELKFECVDPVKFLGSSIWNTIDIFIVVMMIISLGSMILHIVDSFRNLNDMYDEYYTPKHAGYKTKHNGERV